MTNRDSQKAQKSSIEEANFEIPHRPERVQHDTYTVTDEEGNPVTDENDDPVTGGGGTTIKGFTQFTLTCDAYDREKIGTALETADEWGPYVLSEWEPFNQLMYDTAEGCPFEVRVLPDRVAIDVKASTTSESVEEFVKRLSEQVDVEWDVSRTSERISA